MKKELLQSFVSRSTGILVPTHRINQETPTNQPPLPNVLTDKTAITSYSDTDPLISVFKGIHILINNNKRRTSS